MFIRGMWILRIAWWAEKSQRVYIEGNNVRMGQSFAFTRSGSVTPLSFNSDPLQEELQLEQMHNRSHKQLSYFFFFL